MEQFEWTRTNEADATGGALQSALILTDEVELVHPSLMVSCTV